MQSAAGGLYVQWNWQSVAAVATLLIGMGTIYVASSNRMTQAENAIVSNQRLDDEQGKAIRELQANYQDLHSFAHGTEATVSGRTVQFQQIQDHLGRLDEQIAILRKSDTEFSIEIVGLKEDMLVIQNEICSLDIVRNTMHASDLRMLAVIWKKVFSDAALPIDNAYYPQICNQSPLFTKDHRG